MAITRRELLRRAALLGGISTMPALTAGCEATADDPIGPNDGPLGPETTFEHGVASGDPLADSVVLWTRISRGELAVDRVVVDCEVAEDPSFDEPVWMDRLETVASRDFTVHVDVDGLAPATTYYYRFTALGRISPIGRTRTAPAGAADRLRFGVCSCSNYGFGYFHNYRRLAERADLDAVIHLGDYVYEYASAGFGKTYGEARPLDPPQEVLTLDDYRRRYSWYRRDPDLLELHRQHPMIHVWDDHEFANDPGADGTAENHDPATEGTWSDRVANAVRAYGEWMPTRLRDGGRIFRALSYGPLASIVLVDRQRHWLFPDAEEEVVYLGREQADWLDATIVGTEATWLVLAQASAFAARTSDGLGGSVWTADARERVLDAVDAAPVDNLVVLGGDLHRADALDIVPSPADYDPETGDGSHGVELLCGSVTSVGANGSTTGRPHFRWSEGTHRHYLVIDVTPEALAADWFGFPHAAVASAELPVEQWRKGFRVLSGEPRLVAAAEPALPRADAPPLAP